MFAKNFWTLHCQTLEFCTCVHSISRISTKAGFYFLPTGSDVIGQWRHRANWEKFRQRWWSYYIPLERKLNADSDSHYKHGLKMNPSRDIMVYMLSRDITTWAKRKFAHGSFASIYTSKGPAGESPISTIISKLPYFNDGPPLLGKLTLCNGWYLEW